MVRNKYGQVIFETSSWWLGKRSTPVSAGKVIHVQFSMNFPLAAGDYSFSIGIADKEIGNGLYDDYLLMLHDITMIHVLSNDEAKGYSGIFNMKPSVYFLED